MEIGTSLPDADGVSLVLDSSDCARLQGRLHQPVDEILRLPFSSPFRYDGGGLMVLIGLDNETTQQGLLLRQQSGHGPVARRIRLFVGGCPRKAEVAPLPTTTFYYAARRTEAAVHARHRQGTRRKAVRQRPFHRRVQGRLGDGNFVEYPWQAPCRPTTTSMPRSEGLSSRRQRDTGVPLRRP